MEIAKRSRRLQCKHNRIDKWSMQKVAVFCEKSVNTCICEKEIVPLHSHLMNQVLKLVQVRKIMNFEIRCINQVL
jgi:hypothetical protein